MEKCGKSRFRALCGEAGDSRWFSRETRAIGGRWCGSQRWKTVISAGQISDCLRIGMRQQITCAAQSLELNRYSRTAARRLPGVKTHRARLEIRSKSCKWDRLAENFKKKKMPK